ncbi:anhydro-N-acetylmuramic acid kinase [Volucribacter amazonae]|uniref:Anhydro-N-acetylmuramic acid kinase n=1 Tax=Volucribacter amazonae TaxID=256731 RepID=A0A9X4SKX6_9PAST|nr:anhydro-N-acetylmuramic acid kinase [Volucribacter amazonae]MDG6895559.1 anhydro-N-acetylmuramic acid kinase [Volucribacter amazonae]
MQQYYIGVMSGTSLDGVDLALVDFSHQPALVVATKFMAMPEKIKQKLTALITEPQITLSQLGEADHLVGHLYADCINQFLAEQQLSANDIVALGCHGQTIWHAPQGDYPFTMQIGDMNIVAINTGIQTIGDFRRKDMALGGQGAPLVPAFHQAYFARPDRVVAVLNIGGISNVSLLIPEQAVLGYDLGPGNTLLDQWIAKYQGKSYDKGGEWAKTGQVYQPLLQDLLSEPFFQQPPPKSTGREQFNLIWLEKFLAKHTALLPQDIQATLVALTVQSIVQDLQKIETTLPCELLVCGGGAYNPLLMQGLQQGLAHWQVATTASYGLAEDYVEAVAFAWLAYQRIQQKTSNLPSVTGAKSAVSLGVIF